MKMCGDVSRWCTLGLLLVGIIAVITLCCHGVVTASVGLSLRVNLWETVPSDDPVYEELSRLADLGIIRLPARAQTSLLTRYDIADLIYRADRELRSRSEVAELSFDNGGREIIAGLREEYSAEIQWVSGNHPSGLNGGEQITNRLGLSGASGLPDYERVSSGLGGHPGVSIAVPSLPPASAVEVGSEVSSYSIDPLTMRISGLAVNLAGTLTQLEDGEHGFRNITPYYSLYPKSVRGLKYRIDAFAESPGFELRVSHEGTTPMPEQAESTDATQSEASATYEISPSVKLVAGMVTRSDHKGSESRSGVDLTFQVVPFYLWANLGLNVNDSGSPESELDDWRRFSTEIGLSGEYPISGETMLRAAYSHLRYANASDRSETVLSTGVDYTPLPGATVSAGVEVKDDPEKGLSSVKGVGLGYEINPDTSVMLSLFQTEGTVDSANPGEGAKWGAEFQWKFKF